MFHYFDYYVIMKRGINIGAMLLSTILVSFASSCQKELLNETEMPATRAYGEKTPKVVTYIDVNDTNPLNAMLYRMDNEPFFDVAILYAANIRANGTEPEL